MMFGIYLVEHYVKPHAEGKDVEAIPEKKVGKCLKDIEEHGNIDIVSSQTWMLCHKGYELSCKYSLIKVPPWQKFGNLTPGQKETDATQMSFKIKVFFIFHEK